MNSTDSTRIEGVGPTPSGRSPIRAPRGGERTAKSWGAEAAKRTRLERIVRRLTSELLLTEPRISGQGSQTWNSCREPARKAAMEPARYMRQARVKWPSYMAVTLSSFWLKRSIQ
mgnify:CR=1 FL=1